MASGKLDAHFVVDVFQTGSGTSTNTNANEVIAHRAAALLKKGGQRPHPNDHVNMGQSSNDVIPTAAHLTAAQALRSRLLPAINQTRRTLEEKTREFWDITKTGRTHLQDATPIRLGQEFQGYAQQLARAEGGLQAQAGPLSEVALGGTAVGTGVNTHPDFARGVCALLSQDLGFTVTETSHHFQAQSTLDAMLAASGAVRGAAVALQKIANDLRWLASGPRAGLGELELPAVQPGSSIMPGKVNPVIAESLLQVVAHVMGNDTTINTAAQGGYLELNTYWPVAAYHLHQAATLLASATANFDAQCLQGIQATAHGPAMVEQGLMLATGLIPAIGYDAAAQIAKEGAATGKTVREIAREAYGAERGGAGLAPGPHQDDGARPRGWRRGERLAQALDTPTGPHDHRTQSLRRGRGTVDNAIRDHIDGHLDETLEDLKRADGPAPASAPRTWGYWSARRWWPRS